MGAYYSPLSYFKGGKSCRRQSKKGGFYPSIMSGVVRNGALLVPLAIRQTYKLCTGNSGNSGKSKTKKSKKTKKTQKTQKIQRRQRRQSRKNRK